jgi:mono/diheme cytochrome c family protein
MMQRLLGLGLALCLATIAWVVLDNYADGVAVSPSASTSASVPHSAQQVAQGAYLARAGNCMSCHTVPGQVPFSGGRAIETPFGKVYASNLTPDDATGLGRWNAQHFWRALHHGRSYDGRLLAPAFPYNHTSLVTRADADALFAYFKSLAPVAQATPASELRWPFGTQAAFAVWRSLYFKPAHFTEQPQHSAEWNRGAYLVEGLGHCAACHGPRDDLGGSGALDDLRGGLIPVVNWYAPSLLSARETRLADVPVQDTVRLLQTGHAPHAWVNGPMREVVQHSTQHLSVADLTAMATYLQARARAHVPEDDAPPAPSRSPTRRAAQRGAALYDDHCAVCHGKQGQGVAQAYPALAGSLAVQMAHTTNLVQTVMYGGFSVTTPAQPKPFGMPPFVLVLSDRDIADVLTHIRTQWGNTAGALTEFDVVRVREMQTR